MQVPSDYKDLLKILNRHKVRYLIVGAYAVTYYAEPRYTKDMDIWVDADETNAKRVYKALKAFGAPLRNIKEKDFTDLRMVYQIGVEPMRVNVIMGIPGIKFKTAWEHRSRASVDDVSVNIIGVKELIRSKKKTKRPLDMADIESLKLESSKKQRKRSPSCNSGDLSSS